jgi:predicted MFS family arabinose efflux permease
MSIDGRTGELKAEAAAGTRGAARATARWLPVVVLALGTFCAGTDNYLIAGILQPMSQSLHISVSAAGQYVTAYSLAYAVGAPLVMTVARVRHPRRLLLASIALFVAVNVLAAAAPDAAVMAVARIAAGCLGGVYSPLAAATAAAGVPGNRRGRALAIILGGTSLATLAGVPVGIWISHLTSWRASFLFVAGLAVIACAGIVVFVRGAFAEAGGGMPSVPLRARVAPLRQPAVLRSLIVTMAGMCAGFLIYTYIEPMFSVYPALGRGAVGPLITVQGVGALAGLSLGSVLVDRFGGRPVLFGSLVIFTADMALLPLAAHTLVTGALFMLVWGVVGWAFVPAQQHSMIESAQPGQAPVLLSLNGSAMYFGIALGSAAGGFVTASWGPGWLWAAATAFAAAGLILAVAGRRRPAGSGARS